MADAYKNLAQSAPLATTLTDIYTVPGGKSAVVSSIFLTNRSATTTTFRVAVAVAGAADTTKQYLYYDFDLPAYDVFEITGGIALSATDVLRVYVLDAVVSVNVFGLEVS